SDADILLGDNATLLNIYNVQSVMPGSVRIDSITTTDNTNTTGGNDRIEGNEDDDVLIGGIGDDTLDGNAARDLVLGDNATLTSRPDTTITDPRFVPLTGTTLFNAGGAPQVGSTPS